MNKISLETLEKFIQENIDEIQHMDEVSLPAVLLELQAEQAEIEKIKDHKSITMISEDAIRQVFICWMQQDDGEMWFKRMIEHEKSIS